MNLGGWEAGFQVELDRCFPGVLVGSFQGVPGVTKQCSKCMDPTVDGSEIRLSPAEVGSLSHYLHPSRCRISSINSIEACMDYVPT